MLILRYNDWNLYICLFTVLEIIAIGHFLTDCWIVHFQQNASIIIHMIGNFEGKFDESICLQH